MFRAIGRFFRSLGYFLTGRVDSASRGMDTDPQAMRAKYDDVIRDKTKRIGQYKDAVAGLIAQQENKLGKIKALGEETSRLEDLKAGALAKAQKRVAELKQGGADQDAIKNDSDYQTCLRAYNEFNATLAEKQARITELETDVAEYGQRIQEHKLSLQDLLREIDKLKAEAHEAVADVISAKQEQELHDAVNGIGDDQSSVKLNELRQLRSEVKAGARVSKELAGADTKVQEAEFLEYARASQASSEFENLVGLAEEADAGATDAAAEPDKLPE